MPKARRGRKKRRRKLKAPAACSRRAAGVAGASPGRFAAIYILAMGFLFLLLGLKPLQRVFDLNGLYTAAVVFATARLGDLLGLPLTFHGSVIELPSLALDVKFGCNGLEAVMIYAVAVLAMPGPPRRKLAGVGIGFLVLQVLNIARLVALLFAGVYLAGAFRVIHVYVAQGLMIAVALGMFLLYLRYADSGLEQTG